jgi:hypothetical protein
LELLVWSLERAAKEETDAAVLRQLSGDPVALFLHKEATAGDDAAAVGLARERLDRCYGNAASSLVQCEGLAINAAGSLALTGHALVASAVQEGCASTVWAPAAPLPPPAPTVLEDADPKAKGKGKAPTKKPAAPAAKGKGGKEPSTQPVVVDPVVTVEPVCVPVGLPVTTQDVLTRVSSNVCSIECVAW